MDMKHGGLYIYVQRGLSFLSPANTNKGSESPWVGSPWNSGEATVQDDATRQSQQILDGRQTAGWQPS